MAASNIAVVFVLESVNKIDRLFKAVMASRGKPHFDSIINSFFEMGVSGIMPNFKSVINSLGLDAGAYKEIDNCDKNEKQESCSKRCARDINGIEKVVDVGAGDWERLNGNSAMVSR